MSKKKTNPIGMWDLPMEESFQRSQLEASLQKQLFLNGFQKIETPLLEYLDVFTGESETLALEQIIKMIDPDGSVVALRPDLTVPAARVVATRMGEYPLPIKLYYCGKVYQNSKISDTEGREFNQLGAEIYGDDSIWADLESIRMTVDCLKASGLTEFKLDLGHADMLNGLLEALALEDEEAERIRLLVDGKNLVDLELEATQWNWDESHKALLTRLPTLFGEPEKVLATAKQLSAPSKIQAALHYLEQLCSLLERAGLSEYISLDLGITGSRRYYTGFIMKGYTFGLGKLIASGGRYDRLLNAFGLDCPAAGFAIYMDRLCHVLNRQGCDPSLQDRVLVLYDDAHYEIGLNYARSLSEKPCVASLVNKKAIGDLAGYQRHYGFKQVVDLTTISNLAFLKEGDSC